MISICLSSTALLLLTLPSKTYQQSTGDCSYINGQGCMNGICKFCAMCLPSACILATPYSTGVNEGSTCAVTHQAEGYDFYNYCLSSGMDDNGDYCNTSTVCYSYGQGNASSASHSWDNLTCDSNTCNLVNFDGSAPAPPIPLDNNSTSATDSPTNITTNHPGIGTGSGNSRPQHHNQFGSGGPLIIALTTIFTLVALCLIALLTRILFYKTKYWPSINKYFCCGFFPYKPPNDDSVEQNSSVMIENNIPNTAPPSFQDQSRRTSSNSLPSYFHQDPSPPKYEQAIVTQIRGMRFLDHHPSNTSNSSNVEQPIWVPVYLSPQPPTTSQQQRIFSASFISPQGDWATETMRHQPPASSTASTSSGALEAEGEDIVNIRQHRQ